MPGFINLLTALGWSLLNSIWQMGIIWMAYYILTSGSQRMQAAVKHNLAILFVMTGSGWMVSSFFHLLNNPTYSIGSGFLPVSQNFNRWLPFISCLYLLILSARSGRYTFQYFVARKNKSLHSGACILQSIVNRQAKLLGITKHVQVFLSDFAETAETAGFFKPIILLPGSLLTRLSPEHLEAILVHELFHIRRNDYLINICLSCFRSLLFFNPFAQLFFKEISCERENACDDEVIERGYAPSIYAEALFCLEKFRQTEPGFSIAADGHRPWLLMERIRRVLGKPVVQKSRFSPVVYFSLVLSLGLFGLQQKTRHQESAVVVTNMPLPRLPVRYEMAKLPLKWPKTANKQSSWVNRKSEVRKKTFITPLVISTDQENAEEAPSVENTIFAGNTIVRDYSNQPAAGPDENVIYPAPGAPYVPSVSLTYENLPDLNPADSIRDIAVQNKILELVIQSRIAAKASLKILQEELLKNKNQIRVLEGRNREKIIRKEKNIKPQLENLQLRLRKTQVEIDQLKIQLQISDEEIIHI